MSESDVEEARRELETVLAALRPKLHRYCARMTGTVFDGEDALQDAFANALKAVDDGARPDNLEAWLVRITHNAAIDFLRRRSRQSTLMTDEMTNDAADRRRQPRNAIWPPRACAPSWRCRSPSAAA